MDATLNQYQKHNLHLLLRASLKKSNPLEAIERVNIDPALFADIFLRAEQNREVRYEDLERFSHLCCWVIRWRASQLPEVDYNRTYAGQTDLLLNDLSKNVVKS
ncbi:hypothetical protein HC931_12340 [Candidatus Gracilibacteria bacterium]|jgi:hypothetical protein|nr:hypothetical protein [Candidatus Gracilibacteria bacterium]NJM88497.1 hypothetical protein [Hydrococcus sp. RU_2_2]